MKRFIFLLCLLFFLCSCAGAEANGYASVNGEIITTDEIDYFKSRCRADVINEYAEKYALTDFSDFWDTEYDGETPSATLERRALEAAVSAKLRLVMMREYGIYADVSYDALREKAEKFNAGNKNASGVIGIRSVDMESFYTYYIATGELELKNVLAEGALKPTGEELAEAAETEPGSTENVRINRIVSEKYDTLLAEKLASAEITILP